MDWADELAASVSGPQIVNDSKTPSGTVHVGSLRGPVVHDAIWRALRDRGLARAFRQHDLAQRYGFVVVHVRGHLRAVAVVRARHCFAARASMPPWRDSKAWP